MCCTDCKLPRCRNVIWDIGLYEEIRFDNMVKFEPGSHVIAFGLWMEFVRKENI